MSTERLNHLPEANSKSLQEPESEIKCQTRSPQADAAPRPVGGGGASLSICERAHWVLAPRGPVRVSWLSTRHRMGLRLEQRSRLLLIFAL